MNVLQKYFNLFIFCFVIYLFFRIPSYEKMSNNDIKKLIEDEYRIDVDSIRNLSKLANELTINNKLIIPGGLEIQGPLTVSKDVNISGNTRVSKDVNISGNTTVSKDINISGNSTVGKDVNISGNITINKKITTKGGGNFSGGRYYFTDSEKCGKLRVGCVWNVPGIYAESRKHLALGSSAGEVQFQNNSSRIKGNTGTFSTVNTSTANASKVNISGSSVSLLTLNKTNDATNLIEFKHKGKRKQRFGLDGNSKPWYGSLRGWY